MPGKEIPKETMILETGEVPFISYPLLEGTKMNVSHTLENQFMLSNKRNAFKTLFRKLFRKSRYT